MASEKWEGAAGWKERDRKVGMRIQDFWRCEGMREKKSIGKRLFSFFTLFFITL